jgi:response regulator NasT
MPPHSKNPAPPALGVPAPTGVPARPARLRIAVADDEPEEREYLREMLTRFGHEVVLARSGHQLVEQCRTQSLDLLIVDIKMPDMDGLKAAAALNQGDKQTPVILISGYDNREWLLCAAAEPIMAYLTKPLKPSDVENAIALSVMRFAEFQAVRKEAADLRQALDDRKVIERAKGVVMRRLCIDETNAFHRMKRYASNHNYKLVNVANEILAAEKTFHDLESDD